MTLALPRRDGTLNPLGSPRYEALFPAQLFTAVIGIGFDEDGANRAIDQEVEQGLVQRGFARDDEAARSRLALAGRPLPQREAEHFVKSAATTDASGAPVHAVVTLVRAADGSSGGDRASAFLEGMNRCEVGIYSGHARFGTGPDFDYNFTADLLDPQGNVTGSFAAYKDLVEELTTLGQQAGRSASAEYQVLKQQGRLRIQRINGGNLVINLRDYHPEELGGVVMIDQLLADPTIRRMSQQELARKYRVWLFNGCRSNDYFYNLRSLSPEANAGRLDLFGTRRLVNWNDIGRSALAFLDGILAKHTHQELLGGLDTANPPTGNDGPSHVADIAPR